MKKGGATLMKNNLDDLDFTKLGEKFDEKKVAESPLLSDDHDDIGHYDHYDVHGDVYNDGPDVLNQI
jgi:hypothetical protein